MVANVLGILMAFIGTLVDGSQAGHIAVSHVMNISCLMTAVHVASRNNNNY